MWRFLEECGQTRVVFICHDFAGISSISEVPLFVYEKIVSEDFCLLIRLLVGLIFEIGSEVNCLHKMSSHHHPR